MLLHAITQVRIVDVISGVDRDSRGVLIFDPGAGSADIDGVTVIHHAGNQSASAPFVELVIPPDGNLQLTIGDPDGILDLDVFALRISLWGTPLPNAFDLLAVLPIQSVTATKVTWTLGGALPPGFLLRMGVAARDLAGHRSGALRVRPG